MGTTSEPARPKSRPPERVRAKAAERAPTPAPVANQAVGPHYASDPVMALGPKVQTKVVVGPEGDASEQQADQVAERVVSRKIAPPIIPNPAAQTVHESPEQGRLAQRLPADETPTEEDDDDESRAPTPSSNQGEALPPGEKNAHSQADGAGPTAADSTTQQPLIRRKPAPSRDTDGTAATVPVNPAEEPKPPAHAPTVRRKGAGELRDDETTGAKTRTDQTASAPAALVRACGCGANCTCGQKSEPEPGEPEGGAGPEPAVVRRKAAGHPSAPASRAVSDALEESGGGEPMRPEVRQAVETSTGADLGGARVHSNATAGTAARSINARAFTHGNDIWLAPGESPADVRLMAHEAAHVVQQGSANGAGPPGRRPDQTPIRRQADPNAPAAEVQLPFSVVFKGEPIDYLIGVGPAVAAQFQENPDLTKQVTARLGAILNPPTGPAPETPAFIRGSRVRQLLHNDLAQFGQTGDLSLPGLASTLAERARVLSAQHLLGAANSLVQERLGQDPATVDWNAVIAGLQARLPLDPKTAVEASQFDRYATLLQILAGEAANLEPVVGAVGPNLEALERALVYDFPTAAYTSEMVRVHAEKFLAYWLAQVAGIHYVPENFNLEAFRPVDVEGQVRPERERLLRQFMDEDGDRLITNYILDEWTVSGEAPEVWLAQLDPARFRDQLVDHLTDEFMPRVLQDEAMLHAFRTQAVAEARFRTLGLIAFYAKGREQANAALLVRLTATPLDALGEDERAVADDPAAFADACGEVAAVTSAFFGSVQPGAEIEDQTIRWAQGALAAAGADPRLAGLVLLPELLGYFQSLTDQIDQQRAAARVAVRQAIDVDYDRIAGVVRQWAEQAARFIEDKFKPMLKSVALEYLSKNHDELQQIYDTFDTSNAEFIARLNDGAAELTSLADRLEDGSYDAAELDGRQVTRDDAPQLRQSAQFLRDEAVARGDRDRLDEQRKQIRDALDVFDSVKKKIADGTYDPLDYSSEVYVEARSRLGISELPEGTTVGMALLGGVTAEQNPFLARAIVGWHWRESSERAMEQAIIIGGLTILSVGAMLVPGLGGAILAALDVGLGIGMGVTQVIDAYALVDLARLDTHKSIRGISLEEAEKALHHAWIGLGVNILLTVGPFALERALKVTGGGIELPPAVRRWEEGLSEEDRLLLKQNPALRKTFAETSDLVRYLLTHCSRNCIPATATDAQVARIESFLNRAAKMESKGRKFGDIHNELLREYFYARRNSLDGAISRIESIRNLSKLEKELNLAATDRALRLREAAFRLRGEAPQPLPAPPGGADYSHAVLEHGAEISADSASNRAVSGRRRPDGRVEFVDESQWYDNRFIADAHRRASPENLVGTRGGRPNHEFTMDYPVGRVFRPDGTVVGDVRRVRVILNPDGSFFNAFPIVDVPVNLPP